MKPRHGTRSTALVHCTALLAVCLLVGSHLASLSTHRPPRQPAGPAAVSAEDRHRVAALLERLGGEEEDWSTPRHYALAAQEQWAGGSAHAPGEPGERQRQGWHRGAEVRGRQGPAAHHAFVLAPPEKAQQPAEQAAGAATAAAPLKELAEEEQEIGEQQEMGEQQEAEQQQPMDQPNAAEQEQRLAPEQEEGQPVERQPADPAASVPAPQQQEPEEQQDRDVGTGAAKQQPEQQPEQPQQPQQPEQQQQQQQQQEEQQQRQQPQLPPLKCAVVNNVSTHLDVAAGLAWALQEAGCRVTCYLHHATQGIQDVMSQWYRGQYRGMEAVLQETPQYDVLVVTTLSVPPAPAALGHREIMQGQRHLPPPPHQRVALVVHNPDHLLLGVPLWLPGMLLSEAVQLGAGSAAAGPAALAGRARQAAAGVQSRKARGGGGRRRLFGARADAKATGPPLPPRLQLLALSPNVASYTSSLVGAWAGSILGASAQPHVPVPWLPPLVPWQATPAGHAAAGQAGGAAADDELSSLVGLGAGGPSRPMQHLCIQGAIDPRRRDYDSFFAAASHPAVLAQLAGRGERLLLVGHKTRDGLPPMPQHLHTYVQVAADLPFELYYNTLASCRAILTAFGSDAYVLNKTSSTIAAAIHLEVPLLTEERVLQAYPLLNRAAAFVYDSGLAAPNVARLARAAARRGVPAALARAIRASIAADAAGRRRLRIDEDDEDDGVEREDGDLGREGEPKSRDDVVEQEEASQPEQQGQQQQQAQQASGAAGSPAGAAASVERPPPGSYAAALLAAFDDAAVREARQAARELKAQLMRHNLEVVGVLLSETAAAAAAVARQASL